MVDEIIKHARAIRPAGFRIYTSTYNFQYDAASVAKIDPWLDLWQWCCLSKPWNEIAQLRNISWDPNNELWGTTTSSYWGNYIDYARGAGWSQAWRRYEGLHTHGYMRWFWNDHEGALPGPDKPEPKRNRLIREITNYKSQITNIRKCYFLVGCACLKYQIVL